MKNKTTRPVLSVWFMWFGDKKKIKNIWSSSKFQVKYNHTLYEYFKIITYINMMYEDIDTKYIYIDITSFNM